jgi:hypothetical protein
MKLLDGRHCICPAGTLERHHAGPVAGAVGAPAGRPSIDAVSTSRTDAVTAGSKSRRRFIRAAPAVRSVRVGSTSERPQLFKLRLHGFRCSRASTPERPRERAGVGVVQRLRDLAHHVGRLRHLPGDLEPALVDELLEADTEVWLLTQVRRAHRACRVTRPA